MKKNTTTKKSVKKALTKGRKTQIHRMAADKRLTVGLDLGDQTTRYCTLDEAGEEVSEDQLPTTKTGLDGLFAKIPASRVALHVGTHSPPRIANTST